jgi:hypothetical protein
MMQPMPMPVVQPPMVSPPAMQAPVMQPPMMQPPMVQAPMMQPPMVQAPAPQPVKGSFPWLLLAIVFLLGVLAASAGWLFLIKH